MGKVQSDFLNGNAGAVSRSASSVFSASHGARCVLSSRAISRRTAAYLSRTA